MISHIPQLYGSHPGDGTSRLLGAYLLYTALAVSFVTSSMFITALAPNALAISIIQQTIGVRISWVDWFLGFAPVGHKTRSGDGRTPEGRYVIDRRNARSDYYLSLGVSYPNPVDVARARAMGTDPGGNIFIHGGPRRAAERRKQDWTAGCIAVTDAEIEEIWSLVPTGIPISILA